MNLTTKKKNIYLNQKAEKKTIQKNHKTKKKVVFFKQKNGSLFSI